MLHDGVASIEPATEVGVAPLVFSLSEGEGAFSDHLPAELHRV